MMGESRLQNDGLKTIFIVVELGTAIRNILRTDVFKFLREQNGIRLVVFSPLSDEKFKEEFNGNNVTIEPLLRWKPNKLVKMTRSLKNNLWAEKTNLFAFTNRLERKESPFVRWFVANSLRFLGRRNGINQLIALVEKIESKCTPYLERQTFERYQPDLVFYTTMYSKRPALEIEAQKRKIKTIAFIQSWDNPTSNGPFPLSPDRVIVWNHILRDEVVNFHEFPSEHVYISGAPQFDIYLDEDRFLSKEEFFRKWNLDPDRKLVTYTTGRSALLPDEWQVVEQLYNAVVNDEFIYPCQLLVRLHPKDDYESYQRFENLPHLTVQRPGRLAPTKDKWNPTPEDMYGLAELMYYSDVVVNISSTITIDAACFDTPVVNVAFDGYENKEYKNSCKRCYDNEHYRNIVKTGGVRIVNSIEELVQNINLYLQDPSLETSGRERIRRDQCWKLDGKSGRRIAEYILDYLYQDQ
jgi:hypothetical protein